MELLLLQGCPRLSLALDLPGKKSSKLAWRPALLHAQFNHTSTVRDARPLRDEKRPR